MSQASQIVQMVLETGDLELFHDRDGDAFVMIPAGTHRECVGLRRNGSFRSWVSRLFYARERKAPGSQALADALGVLEGEAVYNGDEIDVHLRVARHEDAIYIDLGEEFWHTVKVTATGWEIVADAPVRFRRTHGLRALPMPMHGGNLDELREFVNVTDDDWPLLAAWAVAAARDHGPYPVLQLHGEQGSSKSTTARMLRMIVDPNKSDLRSEPREVRDLMIAANNGWIVGFDNVSNLQPWMSDALCRLSTGGGFATRELYSDSDEILIDVQRPVMLNGIEDLSTRGDLLDRSLIVYLPQIKEYRQESELWAAYDRAHARIFGALLSAVASALANIDKVEIQRPPRMADFAFWAQAAEPACGIQPGAFLQAYNGNRANAHALSLEASPIGDSMREIATGGFEGTATDLLDRLAVIASESAMKQRTWPKSPRGLAGDLRRIAPNLRAEGIEVEFVRTGRKRLIVVGTTTDDSVTTVTSVTQTQGDDADDGDDDDLRPQSTLFEGAAL